MIVGVIADGSDVFNVITTSRQGCPSVRAARESSAEPTGFIGLSRVWPLIRVLSVQTFESRSKRQVCLII